MSHGVSTKQKPGLGFHFVAGLGSGVASAFLLQPADLLKTRVQQTNAPSLRHALRVLLNGPDPLRSLWRGTTPSVIRTGVGSALYFEMLNLMRVEISRISAASPSKRAEDQHSVSSARPKLGNLANLATGAFARVAAGFLMNPVTVLKVRYESTHYAYTSLFGAASHITKTEGLRSFFAGFGATAVRDAPYAGLYVLIYEQAKTRLGVLASSVVMGEFQGVEAEEGIMASQAQSLSSSTTVNFLSGVIAASAATMLTNPFDAIKTRLQIAPTKYRNLLQAARLMIAQEGVQSMFSGLSLRIGRKALSSAFTWTVYEEFIRRAEKP